MTQQGQFSNTSAQTDATNNIRQLSTHNQGNLAAITMDSLSANIAIFDPSGKILTVNRAWREFAHSNGGDPTQMCEGSNYLDVCRRAAAFGDGTMEAFVENVQHIIEERIDHFSMEYPCHSPTERRWFVAKVTSFTFDGQLCIVVAHEDITPLKLAEEAERKQRIFAEALLDITTLLNSTLDYELVLERILANLSRVVLYDRANIILIEDDKVHIVGSTKHFETLRDMSTPGHLMRLVEGCQTAVIHHQGNSKLGYRTYIGVPIYSGEQLIGVINLEKDGQTELESSHMKRIQAFAAQAAIAITNARLHTKAQRVAVLEERQRLARDLHDSVSQTLFSADLMAQALPQLWDLNTSKAQAVSGELHELTSGALAEMRTLLMELRPSALRQASLENLIKQLATAFKGRTRIKVNEDIAPIATVPYDAKLVFYRITQEALSNIQQHAHAEQVSLQLTTVDDQLQLHISDDGVGFKDHTDKHTHHGLKIMQERANAINAKLKITNQPQYGTKISLYWTNE